MKKAMKWIVIGLVSTLATMFMWMLSGVLSSGGDKGISTILTTHSYEAFIGMIGLIVPTGGLALMIPTVVIALIGFFSEKIIVALR